MYKNVPQDKGAIIRSVVLFIALLNSTLVAAGYSPLPFDDAQVEIAVSTLFTAVAALVAWWKNNNLTREARRIEQEAKRRGIK